MKNNHRLCPVTILLSVHAVLSFQVSPARSFQAGYRLKGEKLTHSYQPRHQPMRVTELTLPMTMSSHESSEVAKTTSAGLKNEGQPYLNIISRMNFKSFHGIGGIIYLLCGFSCLAHLVVNRVPNRALDHFFFLLTVPFLGGLSTKRFRAPLRDDAKRSMFLRITLWSMAFAGLNISVYTLPAKFWENPALGAIPFECAIGTIAYIIGTLWSLWKVAHQLFKGSIVKGTVMASLFTYLTLFFVPTYHFIYGTEALAMAYKFKYFRESIYAVSLCSAMFTAFDTFFFGMVTAGRISAGRYYKTGMFTWGVGYTSCVVFLQ